MLFRLTKVERKVDEQREREKRPKAHFFSSQQSCNFDSFLSLQGFVFFIIDLCKKKCEWLCTYYLTSWMFILQVTQVGKGSSEGKKVQRILLLDYVLGIWNELKIAKNEKKSEAILEGQKNDSLLSLPPSWIYIGTYMYCSMYDCY